MNKEECKLKIISQFKDERSPIRDLMFATPSQITVTSSPYVTQKVFKDDLYGLTIVVDVQSRIGDTPLFQVLISESDDLSVANWTISDENDFSNPLLCRAYYEEKIIFVNDTIQFVTYGYELEVVDYKFSKNRTGAPFVEIYNLKTFSFEDLDIDKQLRMFSRARQGTQARYADFYDTGLFWKQLRDAMSLSGLTNEQAIEVSSAFVNTERTSSSSSMAKAIIKLLALDLRK